jgi:hypothetical protein
LNPEAGSALADPVAAGWVAADLAVEAVDLNSHPMIILLVPNFVYKILGEMYR